MLMDIQYHPVSDAPIHVDFKRIDVAKPVSVEVPLELLNVETARGLKMGGTLNFAVRKAAIVAKVNDIPEKNCCGFVDIGHWRRYSRKRFEITSRC